MTHQTKLFSSVAILVVCIALAVWWSRPRYEHMSSGGYEITLALYSACNAKSEQRIAEIESLVVSKVQQQVIDDREAAWFQEVFHSARSGKWRDAAQQSREILRAQVVEQS